MKQVEMDFSRSDREGALKDVALPRGLGVSPIALASVLHCIYRSGPTCFKKQETIAMECKCSVSTVKRAVAILSDESDGGMNILCVERTDEDRRPNVMSINWQALFDLVETQRISKGSNLNPKGSNRISKGSTCNPNGSNGSSKGSTMSYLNGMNQMNHHQYAREAAADVLEYPSGPVDPPTELPIDREPECENSQQLKSIGLDRHVSLAREFASRPLDVIRAVQTYSRQKSRFKGPGAVVDFLRSGAWPSDGVLTLDELKRRQSIAEARSREKDIDRQRYLTARSQSPPDWCEEERRILKEMGVHV